MVVWTPSWTLAYWKSPASVVKGLFPFGFTQPVTKLMLRLKQHKLFDGQRMEKREISAQINFWEWRVIKARFLKAGLMVEGAHALVFREKVNFFQQLGCHFFFFLLWSGNSCHGTGRCVVEHANVTMSIS